ncbi:MAG: MucR family transcriptional regulator [Sphingomonadales bacterium]|jgi:predicted transcriptional regulator
MANTTPNTEELLSLTVDVVSSHVSNNTVPVAEVSSLIEQVYETLSKLSAPEPDEEPRPEPAVPVRRSVTPDYIICLEDGKKLKMLKRHLKSQYNMSPEDYRERWGLPVDYPMVAPNYAEQRRSLAKKIGLGTSRKKRA